MEAVTALKETREREQVRRLFTRSVTSVEEHLQRGDVSHAGIEVDYLQEKAVRLQQLDKGIQDRLLQAEDFKEKEYAAEMDKAEEYQHKWCVIRRRTQAGVSSNQASGSVKTAQDAKARHYKLPRIEFKKFDDDLKNWLGFWGQFSKIHNDAEMTNEDKFQYLIQAMKEGSNASTLVESFPPSADNYSKAIEQLQARFGREDLLIQVYVRQLLSLVLNHNKNQVSVRTLYDKLSTYLLSLESLGIVKQKYETILYPLVESAIPENLLLAWNRANSSKSTNQLADLLTFLKSEVETEERIKLARSDFNTTASNPILYRQSISSILQVPTAAALVSSSEPSDGKNVSFDKSSSSCCFCDKSGHNTFECTRASKMSLEEKKEAIKRKGCCYICLRKGHMANKCKIFVKCLSCEKRHHIILCPEIHNKSTESWTSENVLHCARNNTMTLLQTLIVNVTYEGENKKVRALLDSGSQRSYVKAAVVKQLGLQPTGTEKIGHMLFGGVEQPAKVYKCFDLKVSNLEDTFSIKINALQQANICGRLPKLKNVKTIEKLRDLNIKISDLEFADTEIGLLIGSDYLGSIISDELVHLGNNLTAVNTNLGWTLQGPILIKNSVNTTISVSCFSKTNLDDLWSVELSGVKDPYEKQIENIAETETLMVYNNNISVNAPGRYEVSLPMKEGCLKLNTNDEVASKRLKSTTKKKKLTGNQEFYDKVLEKWKKDNINEMVTKGVEKSHYSHEHHVIKPSSTRNRVRPAYDGCTMDRNGWPRNGFMDKQAELMTAEARFDLRRVTASQVTDSKVPTNVSTSLEDEGVIRRRHEKLDLHRRESYCLDSEMISESDHRRSHKMKSCVICKKVKREYTLGSRMNVIL